jgi:hypothetical protein
MILIMALLSLYQPSVVALEVGPVASEVTETEQKPKPKPKKKKPKTNI